MENPSPDSVPVDCDYRAGHGDVHIDFHVLGMIILGDIVFEEKIIANFLPLRLPNRNEGTYRQGLHPLARISRNDDIEQIAGPDDGDILKTSFTRVVFNDFFIASVLHSVY